MSVGWVLKSKLYSQKVSSQGPPVILPQDTYFPRDTVFLAFESLEPKFVLFVHRN